MPFDKKQKLNEMKIIIEGIKTAYNNGMTRGYNPYEIKRIGELVNLYRSKVEEFPEEVLSEIERNSISIPSEIKTGLVKLVNKSA